MSTTGEDAAPMTMEMAECDRTLRINPYNSILVNIYNLRIGLLAQKLTSGRNVKTS